MSEVNGYEKNIFVECHSTRFRMTRPRTTRIGSFLAGVASCLLATAIGCATTHTPVPPAAVFPSGAEFRLELADDAEKRRIGYMFREHVTPDEGMLFVFDASDRYPFWMKNCRVNLDIIWLDETHRVVEIAHDLAPCPAEGSCPNVFPMRPASYVLEVAGGSARREGLQMGDAISFYLEKPEGS